MKVALLLALLALAKLVPAVKVNEWPHRTTFSPEELKLREKLNIPPEARRVLILSQRYLFSSVHWLPFSKLTC